MNKHHESHLEWVRQQKLRQIWSALGNKILREVKQGKQFTRSEYETVIIGVRGHDPELAEQLTALLKGLK